MHYRLGKGIIKMLSGSNYLVNDRILVLLAWQRVRGRRDRSVLQAPGGKHIIGKWVNHGEEEIEYEI